MVKLFVGRRWTVLILAVVVAAMGCSSRPASPECTISGTDRAWIDRSLEAWQFASKRIADIGAVPSVQAILFNRDCVLRSGNALSSPSAKAVTWTAGRHGGTVSLPNGAEIRAGVTSFASGQEGTRFFVMSTPSVWAAAGIGEGPSLETSMTAVFLHEASHIAQIGPYGARLGALIDRHALPDSFNDDSLQARFASSQEFAASIGRETALFLDAAAAEDPAEAKRLAAEARQLMRARRERWFVGEDAYFAEAENIWLTFEGAGQWLAYQWMVHPDGGARPSAETLQRFTRGRWWSQTQGFALVMALDRIAGPGWKRQAFGDGALTVPEMLDEALR